MADDLTRVGDMTFGLILANKGTGSGPELLDAGADAAVTAGWRSGWVTDHLMVPRGDEADEYGRMLEALVSLTWVGARHPDLHLGTSVISPAMRDAAQLAKELVTIDVLLDGRLTVGVGVSDTGDLPEYTNMGKADRFTRRGAYVDESLRLWRHLWSGSTEPFTGEFNEVTDFVFDPLPVRQEGIPIWCGGRSQRALRRTAEFGDGYHAAQTGPADLEERLPQLRAALEKTGRPFPFVSTRARVKPGTTTGPVYALRGTPGDMVGEVVRFAEVGNDELILVFDAHEPAALRDAIGDFQTDVVEPAAEEWSRRHG